MDRSNEQCGPNVPMRCADNSQKWSTSLQYTDITTVSNKMLCPSKTSQSMLTTNSTYSNEVTTRSSDEGVFRRFLTRMAGFYPTFPTFVSVKPSVKITIYTSRIGGNHFYRSERVQLYSSNYYQPTRPENKLEWGLHVRGGDHEALMINFDFSQTTQKNTSGSYLSLKGRIRLKFSQGILHTLTYTVMNADLGSVTCARFSLGTDVRYSYVSVMVKMHSNHTISEHWLQSTVWFFR